MKKVILTVLLMAFAVVAFAQTSNSSYKKGYKADVELGTKSTAVKERVVIW